jgi:glycosyltransferase involved in cell wall biosynthesis
MQREKVSAIIPVYNCERYVTAAIESVLAQTYPVHEIIIVDDGSTDGTRAVLEPYIGRIRYMRQEKRGVAAARNNGIVHASGDFIAFLDADDLWLPDKLQLQMDFLCHHPQYGLVYSDMKTFDETGILHESVKIWLNMSPPSGWIFKELFAETLFACDATVFAKACVDRVGYFDESLAVGEDYNMWLRMARHFQIGYLDVPLTKYRQHGSMTSRRIGKSLIGGVPWEVIAIEKVLNLNPQVVKDLGRYKVRKRISRPYYFLGCDRLMAGDHYEARRFFARALSYWPLNWDYCIRYLATLFTPSHVAKIRNLYHRSFPAPRLATSRQEEAPASTVRPLASGGEGHAK